MWHDPVLEDAILAQKRQVSQENLTRILRPLLAYAYMLGLNEHISNHIIRHELFNGKTPVEIIRALRHYRNTTFAPRHPLA